MGKSAEDGFGDIAKGIKKANGNNGTPKGSQRRVSSSIESKWEKFERGAEEAATDLSDSIHRSASRSSSRNGTLKKKTSQSHDNIRRMFEQGNVNAKQTVEKLEQTAEAAVQRTKEAVGMADDRSSIAEENGQEHPEGRRESLGEEHLDGESWANIKDEQEDSKTELHEEHSTPSIASENSSSIRSPSPMPLKSKIPQPAQKESRSRSPVKQSKTASSAIPRPASAAASRTLNTNGTKQQSSSSIPSASKKGAKGIPASNNTTATKDTENIKPAISERSRSDASSSAGSVDSGSSAPEAKDVKTEESDTNIGREQDFSASNVDTKDMKKSGEVVAGELDKELLPEFEEEKSTAQGLSTTDPKEDGATYADKIKEAGVEG
jgi:hypothetical protein